MSTAFVIPCGAAKVSAPAPARELYTGRAFRLALAAAVDEAAATERDLGTPTVVLILSARHGLVELDTVLDPYEQRIGQPGAVTADTVAAQLAALGVPEAYALLPGAYRARLEAAGELAGVPVFDVYEGNRGIGDQRGIAATLRRHADNPALLAWAGAA